MPDTYLRTAVWTIRQCTRTSFDRYADDDDGDDDNITADQIYFLYFDRERRIRNVIDSKEK